jgi:hypothetical protein
LCFRGRTLWCECSDQQASGRQGVRGLRFLVTVTNLDQCCVPLVSRLVEFARLKQSLRAVPQFFGFGYLNRPEL